MAQAGTLFNVLGLLSAILLTIAAFVLRGEQAAQKKGEKPRSILDFLVWLPFAGAVLSSIVLVQAFLGNHFEFDYVVRYSSSDLPTFYKITAFWAGQEGSLLLWILLLTIFTVFFWYLEKRRPYARHALGIIGIAQTFFFLVVTIPANPFKLLDRPALEGFGLNPLLQNLGMIFHPPTIFTAYSLFTIPFAIALAVLWTKELDTDWLTSVRYWTLLAWLFMGIGNVLGAIWAYVELGWGGFWAWDPVENASLLPWLTGTAALHSLTVYEKRKTLKYWTFILTFITFFMCILGTYLTRSGVVASVHAFEKSPISSYFFVALLIILVVPEIILYVRRKDIQPVDIENYASREGLYAIANWLFSLFTFVVLWGTLFPVISALATGAPPGNQDEGLTMQRAFYDTWTAPIMVAIAIALALAPYFSYNKVDWKELFKRLVGPFAIAALIVAATISFWGRSWIGVVVGLIGLTGMFLSLELFLVDFVPVVRELKGNALPRIMQALGRNRRRYGGMIAHFGVLMMFIGVFVATMYKEENNLVLKPGESGSFKDVQITYVKPGYGKGPNYELYSAELTLSEGGRVIGTLAPSFAFYPASNQQTYEVAVHWGFFRDVYLSLKSFDQDYTATIVVTLMPFSMWIWLGSFILFGGTVFALWPRRKVEAHA